MFKKLKLLFISAAALVTVAAPVAVTVTASASDITNGLCTGADLKTSGGSCGTADTNTFSSVLTNIINLLSLIIGVVAVIMVIWGGFNYITSGGDSGKVGTAKSTIMYAIIGLIIVAFAQLIVKFVLNKAKNTTG